MVPYTYLLTHRPSGKRYYGVRYAKGCDPSDLWVTYFSSSKEVKKLNPKDFDIEIRRTFSTREEALSWEQRVLWKMKVWNRPDWFNKTAPRNFGFFGTHTEESKRKISEAGRGRVFSKETREKMSRKAKARGGFSIKAIERAAEVNRSRVRSPEELVRRKHTPETKARIGKMQVGRKHSEETKRKMAESQQRRRLKEKE